jgi:hypothetical protein
MKTSDKGAIVGLLFLMAFMYIAVQLNFIYFYREMGVPFGRSDVDEYMKDIAKPDISIGDHVFIILLSKSVSTFMSPGEFITYYIPIMLCLVMPLTVFILAFILSEDGTRAFYSTMVSMFGTIMFLAFGISSLWAQMESTIFIIWFIILYEIYQKVKSNDVLVLMAVFAILSIVSHCKAAVFIPLYLLIRYFVDGRAVLVTVASTILMLAFVLVHGTVFDPYPYDIDASYVFFNFMFPLLWVLAFYYMLDQFIFSKKKIQTVMILSVVVLVVSSMSVQWRPLLTVLPLFALFATMGLFKMLEKMNPWIAIILGTALAFVLFVFFFHMFQNSMYAMYQEIVPGIYNDTRTTIDLAKFSNMYFPSSRIQVTGYVTNFGNSTIETAKIIDNGSPQIIGML